MDSILNVVSLSSASPSLLELHWRGVAKNCVNKKDLRRVRLSIVL